MSATLAPTSEGAEESARDVETGPIVVATDGTPDGDEALLAAHRLPLQANSKVVVLSVVEPIAVVPMDFGIALPYGEIEAAQRQARMKKVEAQLVRVGLRDDAWTVKLEYGDPSSAVVRVAREMNAALIVTGLGHHDLLDRLLGAETALHIVRASKCPVLSVPASAVTETLPRRMVVATDFSVASLDAAKAALRLFPSITTVHLVHVVPRYEVPPDLFISWVGTYAEPISKSFERLTSQLDSSAITLETRMLDGKASSEIVKYAREVGADLIVTGSRGAGFINRLVVGSTATGIIRGSDCAVLAVPAAPDSQRLIGVRTSEAGPGSDTRWAEELNTFTTRNGGRRTSLEVDDPDYGVLIQEHGYPLRGVSYDHHDRRVAIMLGDLEGTRRHLTRGIANVKSVDVLRDAKGRDRVLRIAHGGGQTLLTFEN